MAALTADKNLKFEGPWRLHRIPMLTNVKIYKGSMVSVTDAGFAIASADTAAHKFMGIADEQVDNTGGASGAKYILVRYDTAVHLGAASGTQGDNGETALVVDDQTVQVAATTNSIAVGKVREFISATELLVKI